MDNNFLNVFELLTIKATNLETSMNLLAAGRQNFQEELVEINSDVQEIEELKNEIKKSIDESKKYLIDEYDDTRKVIERVTEKMFFLLNQIETLPTGSSTALPFSARVLKEISSPAPPKLLDRADAALVFSELNTRRLTILEYSKSPMAKKKFKSHLNFSDFEAEITKEAFVKIPAYMRGRTSLSELQDFLDVVIKCFNEKYEILYKSRVALSHSEYQMQVMYKEQKGLFERQKFITIGDLSRMQNKNIDRKEEKFLQCLRHINILKEIRKNAVVFFIWLQ